MANRVISVEVGPGITRVVEMDYKVKNPRVYNCFSFETPEGAFEDGLVKADENFCNVMKGAMKYFHVKTKKAVFTINSGRIASREVQIPLVKESKVAGLLAANSTEYFPVDLSKYQLVHRVLQKVNTKEEKLLRLMVLAVPSELVRSYEQLAEGCGLSLVAMDYVGNSVVQVMHRTVHDDATIVLKVEENNSMVTILEGGRVALQRNVAYGIDEAVEVLMNSQVYGNINSYVDAIQVMRTKPCIRRHIDAEVGYAEEEDVNDAVLHTREEITESLRMLIGGIGRVLDYYLSRNGQADIRNIQLVGIAAECMGLAKLMTNELGIKVMPFRSFPDVRIARSTGGPDFRLAEYVTCIGGTFNPMNFRFGQKAEEAAEGEKQQSLAIGILVACVGVVAALGMVGYCVWRTTNLNNEKSRCNERITELYPAQQVYEGLMAAEEELESCETMYGLVDTPCDAFLDFMKEMEDNMPSDIIVQSLSANEQGVTFSLTVSSKEEMSDILIQLRSFDTLGSVACGSISESTDEIGSVQVSASVTCTYSGNMASDTN